MLVFNLKLTRGYVVFFSKCNVFEIIDKRYAQVSLSAFLFNKKDTERKLLLLMFIVQ